MNILCNSFSLKMLPEGTSSINLHCEIVNEFPKDCVSFVGHQDTANLLGVEMHREDYHMSSDDTLYIAQYMGPRLPEGATTLPEGAKITIFKINID